MERECLSSWEGSIFLLKCKGGRVDEKSFSGDYLQFKSRADYEK
jgi:hypothetical protein